MPRLATEGKACAYLVSCGDSGLLPSRDIGRRWRCKAENAVQIYHTTLYLWSFERDEVWATLTKLNIINKLVLRWAVGKVVNYKLPISSIVAVGAVVHLDGGRGGCYISAYDNHGDRLMRMSRAEPTRVAEVIVQQLETLILAGVLRPGERLPAERELSERLEVSRPTLREALHILEEKGLVHSQHGGGTFVAKGLGASFSAPLINLFQSHPDTALDYVEFRRNLEGMAAYYAALRRTDADCDILKRTFEAMEEAHQQEDPGDEADIDAEFHLAIAEAAHNVVLLHVVRALFGLLREGVFYNRDNLYSRRGVRNMLLEQHRAIYQAIVDGAPEEAREAAEAHLRFVHDTISEVSRQERRREVAMMRLEKAIKDMPKKGAAPKKRHGRNGEAAAARARQETPS